MPDPTFIAGYLGTVTINAADISAIGHVTSLNKNRAGLAKRTFGNRYAFAIGGQRDFTFSAQGSISAEQAAAINTAYETDIPVAFSLQVGEAAGPTDGGVHTGTCVITALVQNANAEGQWEFSIDAMGNGIPLYTPPA